MKTLVLLLLLQFHQITCSKNSSANKEVNCHDWFPEPITYRLDESHSQLTLDFKIVDDLISDREINESNQIVEDYVIRILNMENGYGGYSDILGIVFKHLPTVRQLIISIFCINTAVIIFSIIWKLGFSEIFEVLGIALRFYEYRSGLTIIPIFCCLGLLILTSNLRSSSGFLMDGIDNLELKNDERFMPIQDRVARKLEMTPCFFDKDFARNIKIWRIEDRYLTKVLNTTMLDKLLPISEIQKQLDDRGPFFSLNKPLRVMFNDVCEIVEKHAGQMILKLEGDLRFENLQLEVEKLQEEYKKIIRKAINISIPSTKEAIGSIGGFVEKYHQNVILIPKIHIINFYEKFVATTVALTVAVSATLTVLFVLEFEFKTYFYFYRMLENEGLGWFSRNVVGKNCVPFFWSWVLGPGSWVLGPGSWVLGPGSWVLGPGSWVLGPGSWVLGPGSWVLGPGSWVLGPGSWVLGPGSWVLGPGSWVLGPGSWVLGPGSWVLGPKSLELKKTETFGIFGPSEILGRSEISRLNATKSTICSFNEEVKLNPIDKSIIRETAYSKWVEALVPLKGLPVIRNSSMEIVRSPMQIYLVFENPSKKLRPTILEHMLDMAVGIGKMAPIYFILSIYFMCILPIMMDQNSEDGGGGSDEKTPKIDSKSKS
ncbi:Protein CBG05156 [Caenorhabditis briggsae]|uniref:Protein CBG05156 n=1 Tax=Caenorhabditis briggsae TaxID=6238 RepID=A8WZ53_CAEBR|nr:Protein CBG05156 [Caenorhabditis briggsae]CAP25663.2 Protein CBG05156 [Caenorhabditis briggsae]